jgi:hypothetical protein
VIKVHLLVGGGIIYLNPHCIERVYATTANPNNSVIVLTTGVPDVAAQETNDQILYALRASNT